MMSEDGHLPQGKTNTTPMHQPLRNDLHGPFRKSRQRGGGAGCQMEWLLLCNDMCCSITQTPSWKTRMLRQISLACGARIFMTNPSVVNGLNPGVSVVCLV